MTIVENGFRLARTGLGGFRFLFAACALLLSVSAIAGDNKNCVDKDKSCFSTHQTSKAVIGEKAPDFELEDLTGKKTSLSKLIGNIVVLEWFNPECPFVNLAHSRELSLKNKSDKYSSKGVVWLAINSNGPGKQGNGVKANKAGKQHFGFHYPVLLDPDGRVGRSYGALRTPHMFVIDKTGTLVYKGAIDNTQGGDPDDADPPPARNYVDDVLDALLSNRKPQVSETEAWGCTVKYPELNQD